MATVRLYDTAGASRVAIELDATWAGAGSDATVNAVVLTSPAGVVTYPVRGAVKPVIVAAYLNPAGGATDLRLQAGPGPLVIAVALDVPTGMTTTVPFLDRSFQVAGVDLELVLSLPGPSPAAAPPPLVVLSGQGTVSIDAGGTTFASVAIGFRLVIDGLPAFPSDPLAVIELVLPGDIPWPRLRIPWPDFPKLPSFPIRLPGQSVPLEALPVRLAFKAVTLSVGATGIVTLHVEGLEIDGVGGALVGSFDLVFHGPNADLQNVMFQGLPGITAPTFKSLSPGCFGFDWSGTPINALVGLVTTEAGDASGATDNTTQLRVHAPKLRIDEVRLDWSANFANRTFTLPGFQVSVPAPRMFSLVAHRPPGQGPGAGPSRLTLAATFDAAKMLTAQSTFSWPLSDTDRELHHDGTGANSDSLIAVSATTANPVSIVLFDLPIGQDGPPRFLQQLQSPLGTLAQLEAGATATDPCPNSPIDIRPLSLRDWTLALKFNPPPPNNYFTLPFLNLFGSDYAQSLRLTNLLPTVCSMSGDRTDGSPPLAQMFRLTVGGAAHAIDLNGTPTLAHLAATIGGLGLGVAADVVNSPSGSRLILIPTSGTSAVLESLAGTVAADFCPAIGFSCSLTLELHVGSTMTVGASASVIFDPARMAFLVDHSRGLWLTLPGSIPDQTFLGLNWKFTANPADATQPDGSVVPKGALLNLATRQGNYQIRQAPGSTITIEYDRATMPGEPIVFRLTDLAITPKGVDLTATITDKPARFNGLETQFRFTIGEIQVRENLVKGFAIGGNGPLPPALVDNASADVFLQFGQASDGGPVRLQRGSAKIKGSNLLSCHLTRFDFSLDGIGLEFVDDGKADHLYFTLTGKAKYAPLSGDDSSGPLAWLPKIEIQLVDCPLTGNPKVIAQHVKFLVELPKKVSFSLMGCFNMEVRAIGFVPEFAGFKATADPNDPAPTSAMQVSGQISFAETGDVIETKIDFHDLFVALPARGEDLPRIHCKGLGLTIKQGDAFELSGEVDFFNDEPVDKNPDGSPIYGDGFAGTGTVLIQGLPKMTATFAFLRVSLDGRTDWKRAWFLYLEADQMSIQIPVVEIFIREIGLGFGYRYTLAAIKASDEINDPRKLLKTLKQLAKTQGNLSSRDQWRVDLEGPGESARWTVVLRAMISETSAQAGPFGDYDADVEQFLACLFLMDVVIALRSDLTFLMAGRAWIDTNYTDFDRSRTNNTSLKDNPLFAAFVLLSPRQKRFLANLSSNPNAEFGDHPPLPDFLKAALRGAQFTATLLVEPDLFHLELGWPDQLRWDAKLGPLQVEIRGGAIFRVSKTELVIGNSFLARGTLNLTAGFDAGVIGASLSAFAQVAYGARYIGVLNFVDVTQSAFYGAIGIEIHVTVSISFWIKIPLVFTTIKLDFNFSFGISFTAALEVGITLDPDAGLRGSATIGLQLMGHSVQFDVRIGLNDEAVDKALDRTNRFLHIGLEATDVEPVPGTPAAMAQPAAAHLALNHQVAMALRSASLLRARALGAARLASAAATPGAGPIKPPLGYSLVSVDAPNATGPGVTVYYLLVPKAEPQDQPQGFYPPPLDDATFTAGYQNDFQWTFPAPTAASASKIAVAHLDPLADPTGDLQPVTAGTPITWKFDWAYQYLLNGAGTDAATWSGHSLVLMTPATPDGIPIKGQKRTILAEIGGVGGRLYLRTFDANGQRILDTDETTATGAAVAQIAVLKAHIAPLFPPHGLTQAEVDQTLALVRGLMGGPDGSSLILRKFLDHAFLTDLNNTKEVVPIADPLVVGMPADPAVNMTDPRVQNPDADAYESAVRGAFAEVTAPFFKFDEQSTYDGTLKRAFALDTTIYHRSGSTKNLPPLDQGQVDDSRRAIQLRGTILHMMLRDVQQYAALDGTPDPNKSMADLRKNSPAFRLGMVFRVSGPEATSADPGVRWLESTPGQVQQRSSVTSKAVDSGDRPVSQFNKNDDGFAKAPPAFSKVRKFEHAEMVAIAWELQPSGALSADDLEHRLSHYQVSRLHLNGTDPELTFQVKKGEILHNDAGTAMRLQPRFQMIDKFDNSGTGISALTEEGKIYLYTITPVDLSGGASPRPLSIVATRLPAEPPLVPGDGELILNYSLPDNPAAWMDLGTDRPKVRVPDHIFFQWSDPLPAPGTSPPAVDSYRLIFRRENALPIGFFGADADTRGGRTDGFPVTNARTLRTDRVIAIPRKDLIPGGVVDPETGLKIRADSGRLVQRVALKPADLQDRDILPSDGVWRPDAWRVFVQAVAPRRGPAGSQVEGVPSALAAVTVNFHFEGQPAPAAVAYEERKLGILEWVPDPIRFDLLPPEDQTSRSGFAQVPMPPLDDKLSNLWRYSPTAPIPADGSLPGLRFEAHPERFRALRMTWNQGPSATNTRPIELHAKYQVFEFDADAKTADALDFPPGQATYDVALWARKAGLRLVQEVELMPAEDLALIPTDTSNPVAWDLWTPATSRRILLRRAMIEARTWPETTDRTQLGPWFSWRDSYLQWPPPGDPPPFDPIDRRNWPFHALFVALFRRLLGLPDGPPPSGSSWPLAKYSVEISRGATRGDQKKLDPKNPRPAPGGGTPVNPYPDANNPQPRKPTANVPKQPPSPLGAFLASNAAGSDPHGWGVLDRMGLAVGFRVRLRQTGTYVIGRDLAVLVQSLIANLKATLVSANLPPQSTHKPGEPITLNLAAVDDHVSYRLLDGTADPTRPPVPVPKGTTASVVTVVPPPGSPVLLCWGTANIAEPTGTVEVKPAATTPTAFDDALTYLSVESLFQAGARTDIGLDDHAAGDPIKAASLLALARLSLRPKLTQRMRYQAFEITGASRQGISPPGVTQPGSPIRIELSTTNADAWYMLQTGTPGVPIRIPPGPPTVLEPIMPKEGSLVVLLQGVFDALPTIATVSATDPAGQPQPTPLVVKGPMPFAPTDWRAKYFAVPAAQDAGDPNAAPWAATGGTIEQKAWAGFGAYLAKIRADLALPNPGTGDMATLLTWLDRFFEEGGDMTPLGDGTAPAATADGPWVASAYLRASTPIALTPDPAGRITYYQMIEDQWGHTYRFFLRPQGRYDLLWATLSQSPGIFDEKKARGTIAAEQAKIAAPEPGGMDVVLDRIRPLAAPLVLSSRRLDPPSPPGQSVPPGAIWEVIVAKHPEQALIEKNRSLVNHLGFRQVARTLARSMADPRALAEQKATLAVAVTGVIGNPRLLPRSYKLTVGAFTRAFDLDTGNLALLLSKINGLGLPVVAKAVDVVGTTGETRVVLTPTAPTPLASDVQLLGPVAAAGDVPTTGTDLLVVAEVDGVLHFRAFDAHGLMVLDIDETMLAAQAPQIATFRAKIKPLVPPHVLANPEKSPVIADVTALAYHTPPLGLASVVDGVETVLTSQALDLSDPRFEVPINSRPTTDPRQIPPPALPGPPTKLDHLDLENIQGDDLLSIDLPLRPFDFDQGVMALQWRSLPFYYRYKLLLIAQTSAVVSPITSLDQRDFQYISPTPAATMQGVPNLAGVGRRRKITIRLARYWDGLPEDAQARWPIEAPASVGNDDPDSFARRLSSLIDPVVVYQVVVTHPSRNVQVVAEYLHDPTEVSGYQSRPLTGPFRGDAIRALPPVDGPAVGSKDTFLETLLTSVTNSGGDDAEVTGPISGRAAFSGAAAAGVVVAFPPAPAVPLTACALRITGTLTPAQVADVRALAAASDPTFATPLLRLLAQPGPDAYAEACIGLEQLGEIHPGVTIDAVGKAITWAGEASADEQAVLTAWIKTSLFSATLTNLLKELDGQDSISTYPANAANPTQADTTIPATRLAIAPTGLTWSHRLTQPTTAREITELNTLKGKPGLPAAAASALAALIADVTTASTVATVVPIDEKEKFWKPRPTQGTLPASLQGVLLVGHGAIGFRGLMSLAEGKALRGLAGLSGPDQAAVARLFASSLEGGLDGGTLEIRARRGGADAQTIKVDADLTQAGP